MLFRHRDGLGKETLCRRVSFSLNSSGRETARLAEEEHLRPAEGADLQGIEGVVVPIVLLMSE